MIRRLRACLIHLLISACVVSVAAGWIYFILYPFPLAQATGLGDVFSMVVFVDVVLGPFITFVVYANGKKNIKSDLMIIALIQICALGYGLWTIFSARPAWLVFNVDRFDVAQAHELDLRFLSDADPKFRTAPFWGPRWVASRAPEDISKRNALIFESIAGGADLPQRIDLYVPLEDESGGMKKKAHTLDELASFNSKANVSEVLRAWPEADGWLPLIARTQSKVVLLSNGQRRPLAIVNLSPWLAK